MMGIKSFQQSVSDWYTLTIRWMMRSCRLPRRGLRLPRAEPLIRLEFISPTAFRVSGAARQLRERVPETICAALRHQRER